MNKWIITIIMIMLGAGAVKTADHFLRLPPPKAAATQTISGNPPKTSAGSSGNANQTAPADTIPPQPNANVDETLKVFDTALTYAKTSQCTVGAFDENNLRNNVFLINDSSDGSDTIFRTYAVLYQSDPECAGGSGTAKYSLAEVEVSSQGGGHVRVSNPDLFAKLNNAETGSFSFNDRFIRKASIDSKGILTIEYNEYTKTDGNCCPSERWESRINLNTMTQLDKCFLRKENPYAEN